MLTIKNLVVDIKTAGHPVRPVDGISLSIAPGETFALLGESGCGKSMTAMAIMRLLPEVANIQTGSQILFENNNLPALPENQMRLIRGGDIGMIFQEPMTSLNPVMTVGQQIIEAVKLHDQTDKKQARKRAIELLNDVGIPDAQRRIDEYPHQLSGGMKQRVMIAMTLAGKPRLLIADEPTTALDVTIQAQVLDLLKNLQQQYNMAILLITHDLGVVAEMAHRVGVMYAGQLVENAPVIDFFKQPAHPYSRRLFSTLPSAAKRQQMLEMIPGTVPKLDTEFTECRFKPRCDIAGDACNGAMPKMQTMAHSQVRCFYPDTQVEKASAKQFENKKASSQDILDVTHLKVHFPIRRGFFKRIVGHVKAVDDFSLSMKEGQTVALVGESGCGKTTAGKGILQLIPPTSGDVLFDGNELTTMSKAELRKRRSDMQIVFQDPASSMNPRMLVGDIVAEGMKAQKIGNKQSRQQRITELLQTVGLPADAAYRYPHEFSGGQRQRICVARALAVDPKLIVCDEPTSALDVSVQAQILNLLRDLQQQYGLSYLFITHNISVVSFLADEVMVMYLGRIVEQGSSENILTKAKHPYTRALLSAVPQIDQDTKIETIRLAGDMPSPANPPNGCYFHPRCEYAQDICKQQYPDAQSINEFHKINCHFPLV